MSPTRFRCANSLNYVALTTTDTCHFWCISGPKKRGHEGIEPSTSPTLKENHTTRPMARTWRDKECHPATAIVFVSQNEKMLGVGFEPTHPKILELESSALDRSAIQAIGNEPKLGGT